MQDEVNKMRELTNFKANEDYKKVLDAKPFEPKVEHKSTGIARGLNRISF